MAIAGIRVVWRVKHPIKIPIHFKTAVFMANP
jgi:hypothetical protein